MLGDVAFSDSPHHFCLPNAACGSPRDSLKAQAVIRAALAALFWPQRDAAGRFGSLRVALTRLPRELIETLTSAVIALERCRGRGYHGRCPSMDTAMRCPSLRFAVATYQARCSLDVDAERRPSVRRCGPARTRAPCVAGAAPRTPQARVQLRQASGAHARAREVSARPCTSPLTNPCGGC